MEENRNNTNNINGVNTSMPKELNGWFPMFVNLNQVNIGIVGGGKIAERRIRTLLRFSCNLKIIAPEIRPEIRQAIEEAQAEEGNRSIEVISEGFKPEHLEGANIFLAATNNRELNAEIGRLAREKGILVNVADDRNLCDFYFPGMVIKEPVVVGVTAQGKDHSLAKKVTSAIRKILEEL